MYAKSCWCWEIAVFNLKYLYRTDLHYVTFYQLIRADFDQWHIWFERLNYVHETVRKFKSE